MNTEPTATLAPVGSLSAPTVRGSFCRDSEQLQCSANKAGKANLPSTLTVMRSFCCDGEQLPRSQAAKAGRADSGSNGCPDANGM